MSAQIFIAIKKIDDYFYAWIDSADSVAYVPSLEAEKFKTYEEALDYAEDVQFDEKREGPIEIINLDDPFYLKMLKKRKERISEDVKEAPEIKYDSPITTERLLYMKLHESIQVNRGLTILRVIGGWIYIIKELGPCFVPDKLDII